MQRITVPRRKNAQQRLEDVGYVWHGLDTPHPFWLEGVAYQITPAEQRHLEQRSQELLDIAYEAVRQSTEHHQLWRLGIPEFLHQAIYDSWQRDDPSVYLRMDLAWTGGSAEPKLLEINAQTPTTLIEASVAQWQWLEDARLGGYIRAGADQWNEIHEALTEQWAWVKTRLPEPFVTFASGRSDEDCATSLYMEELARSVGLRTQRLFVDQLGTSPDADHLIDLDFQPITTLHWLWPYEFAWSERDALYLATTKTRLMEPLWKAVMSSKGLLVRMHEIAPGHPCILPARDKDALSVAHLRQVVSKPMFSREGQNVTLPGEEMTPGEYADYPLIEQEYADMGAVPTPDGPRYPLWGVWAAGEDVCGLSIREGGRVTTGDDPVVPHFIAL